MQVDSDYGMTGLSLTSRFGYKQSFWISLFWFNPQAPVAQKISDEVFFWRFQGEGVEFF